jgi:dipeptidyl aminopeptidase/acylaminoacyl peptidase
MTAPGASPEGDRPFLSTFNTSNGKQKIIWRSQAPYFEQVVDVIDPAKLVIVTAKESVSTPVNYYLQDLKKKTSVALTAFPHPQPLLKGVQKQLLKYKRKDGVDLTAMLYLPEGYDPAKDGRLPVLMWAYPREYKSASDAAQVRGSAYRFTRVNYGSPIFWVTRGFAVMDATEMPIVGEGDKEPNDTFVEQLVMNAEAAVNKITEMGVGDKDRIAVGGHSYGAFMTANLLAHTNLFKAGISRSGAYNRTLTPFGFQNEQRTYWQAPDVYYKMSPFSYADKLKAPILLIHGEADNNSGTFPIQSERLYNAIKGNGGTARLVFLPQESHGYAAKESVLHMLWEMDEWLMKYVK